MNDTKIGVMIKSPKGILSKTIKVDVKQFITIMSKGVVHVITGNWHEIPSDFIDGLCALDILDGPEELAYKLIERSLLKTFLDLIVENADNIARCDVSNENIFLSLLQDSIVDENIKIDRNFFENPCSLPLVPKIQKVIYEYFVKCGLSVTSSKSIAEHVPAYFIYALNKEWSKNYKQYKPILDVIESPFSSASEREFAWATYRSLLQRRIQESIFDESFSLAQIYIPLNAYFNDEVKDSKTYAKKGCSKVQVVVQLQDELHKWLSCENRDDVIRVISGGPGSGKSSFARIFAANIASSNSQCVLYVPLHLIDPEKDLCEEVGKFSQDEGIPYNPLASNSSENNLLIIFDGLDELASQGKASAETARAFIREVEKTVEKRNLHGIKLRVLISGRELVVQENESEFRKPRQILNLLPYCVKTNKGNYVFYESGVMFLDKDKLLENDLRNSWWKNYGKLTGKNYAGMPPEIDRSDLDEVTSQPLLNYLVALSFTRGALDFSKKINLNSVYSDLLAAVHERGYEKKRIHGAIKHMGVDDFVRVLEEIGLAAWHGDGRSTTVSEIENHCKFSGLGRLLDTFKEGAKAGVTKLLAAFFFRQYGKRASGDPTFVFTHKSFGEYLAARRIVRAISKVSRELERREHDHDDGYDHRQALVEWIQICGSSVISPYIHGFLVNEVRLRGKKDVQLWQKHLLELFRFVLKNGAPLELVPNIGNFKKSLFHSRNAEEALLVSLNACSLGIRKKCSIKCDSPTSLGAWLKRIQGQRSSGESVLAVVCFSRLELMDMHLHIADFLGSDFSHSELRAINAAKACFGDSLFIKSIMVDCRFSHADFSYSNFSNSQISNSDLAWSRLEKSNFLRSNLNKVNFSGSKMSFANFRHTTLSKVTFDCTNLQGSNFQNANLISVTFRYANLSNHRSPGSDYYLRYPWSERFNKIKKTNFKNANLQHANFKHADLRGVRFNFANLNGAKFDGADLRWADLRDAVLDNVDFSKADIRWTKFSTPKKIKS